MTVCTAVNRQGPPLSQAGKSDLLGPPSTAMILHVIRNTWTETISPHKSFHVLQDHVPLQLTVLNQKY